VKLTVLEFDERRAASPRVPIVATGHTATGPRSPIMFEKTTDRGRD
jgi:hypothetical protein